MFLVVKSALRVRGHVSWRHHPLGVNSLGKGQRDALSLCIFPNVANPAACVQICGLLWSEPELSMLEVSLSPVPTGDSCRHAVYGTDPDCSLCGLQSQTGMDGRETGKDTHCH